MTNVFHNLKKLSVGLVLAGALSYSADASAQTTETANLDVSASVAASCTISTAALNFGNYDPVDVNATADLTGTGTVTITCTDGASVDVKLDLGLHENVTQRRLQNVNLNFLNYDLYSDVGLTTRWDETTFVTRTGTGAADVLTVYGKVDAGQTTAEVGTTYSDTVVASVTF